jgi:hypothetical protein
LSFIGLYYISSFSGFARYISSNLGVLSAVQERNQYAEGKESGAFLIRPSLLVDSCYRDDILASKKLQIPLLFSKNPQIGWWIWEYSQI